MNASQGKGECLVKVSLWIVATSLLAGLATAGFRAVAHHASAPFYDETRSVEAEGVVTKFVFKNPHSFLHLAATDESGQSIAWEIEMGAAVSLSRRGWTPGMINAGDAIKAVGRPSRAPGTYGMCCAELTRLDGSPIRP